MKLFLKVQKWDYTKNVACHDKWYMSYIQDITESFGDFLIPLSAKTDTDAAEFIFFRPIP